jgi:hypothetical protein
MTILEWTTVTPNEPGWYYAYENLDPMDNDILIVYISEEGSICSMGVAWDSSHFSHWMGPICFPNPPHSRASKLFICTIPTSPILGSENRQGEKAL